MNLLPAYPEHAENDRDCPGSAHASPGQLFRPDEREPEATGYEPGPPMLNEPGRHSRTRSCRLLPMPSNAMKTTLKALVTIGLLTYVASRLDFQALVGHLADVDLSLFLAAVGLMLLPILVTSARWQVILRSQDIHLRLRYTLELGIVAQFFNSFLPGTTGGDAVRAFYVFSSHPDEKTRIITSLIVDRFLGLIAFFATASFLILFLRHQLPVSWAALFLASEIIAGISIILVLFGWAYFRLPSHAPAFRKLTALVRKQAHSGIPGKLVLFFQAHRRSPGLFIISLALSFASCLLIFVVTWLVAHSIQVDMDLKVAALIMSIVTITTALPVSLGGHGVRELTLISLLAPLGVIATGDIETPVAFSLLLVATQFFWGVIGGIWYLAAFPGQSHYKGLSGKDH